MHDGEPVRLRRRGRVQPVEAYLTLGRNSDAAVKTSDYTGQQIYYRSIQRARKDYLTAHDYLWRWDTDWFWCSAAFGRRSRWSAGSGRAASGAATCTTGSSASDRHPSPRGSITGCRGPQAGARRPGRRDPGRPAGRVPALVPRRGRDPPGLAVPAAAARRDGLAAVPARAGHDVRQRRLLGHRPDRSGRRRRRRQPPDRGGRRRVRRAQVAVLRRTTTGTPSTGSTTSRP